MTIALGRGTCGKSPGTIIVSLILAACRSCVLCRPPQASKGREGEGEESRRERLCFVLVTCAWPLELVLSPSQAGASTVRHSPRACSLQPAASLCLAFPSIAAAFHSFIFSLNFSAARTHSNIARSWVSSGSVELLHFGGALLVEDEDTALVPARASIV